MRKNNLCEKYFKIFFGLLMMSFVFLSNACANPLNSSSDIHAEIQKYEWTDLYEHEYDYEETCLNLFLFLPIRLHGGNDFIDSLEVKINNTEDSFDLTGSELSNCLMPHYGGVYEKGIPVKNRQCFKDCYSATIEFLKTTHREYIELGIIQKKK